MPTPTTCQHQQCVLLIPVCLLRVGCCFPVRTGCPAQGYVAGDELLNIPELSINPVAQVCRGDEVEEGR